MSSKSSLGTPPICCETKYKTKYGYLEIIHQQKNFDEAKEFCEKQQTRLFALDTKENLSTYCGVDVETKLVKYSSGYQNGIMLV